MEIAGFDITELGLIITSLSSVTGFIWGFIERKQKKKAQEVSLKASKLSNIEKLEQFLNDDIEQIHKINDTLKWRLDNEVENINVLKIMYSEVQKENKKLILENNQLKRKDAKTTKS